LFTVHPDSERFFVRRSRIILVLASAFGATGVALGAFAAHGLRSSVSPEMASVFETGVRYQMYHTFALLVTGWFLERGENRKLFAAAFLFVTGIVLFSGSLYALALTNIQSLGWITPFGGLSFIGGWIVLGWGVARRNP
jgi:uncharacterized membrane protein YgdD (TMEM256/DUF423 family)